MFQSMFLNRKKQLDSDKSKNLEISKHQNKQNRCLKFSNAFFESTSSLPKNEVLEKIRCTLFVGYIFHRFGIAVNAEP